MGWVTNGKMNRKLLHTTLKTYLVFSIIVLIIASPLFYIAIQKLYLKEADDTLILHKNEFLKYSLPFIKTANVDLWNKLNRNIKLQPGVKTQKDSLFFVTYFDTLDAENEPYRELHSAILIDGKPYTYEAKVNLVEKEDLLINIAILFIGITIILIGGLFFLTKLLSKQIWKPFYSSLALIENFEIDKNTNPLFTKTNIEEFNRLNNSLSKLIEKNIATYKLQKEFVENAAHELQTPLAVFQAKIDTLIQRQDVNEAQLKILNTLDENVSRLKRLNKNLLLLSKLENDTYQEIIPVNLNDFLQHNLDFFTEQALAKNIDITFEENTQINILTNPLLAESFISNLFLNAIRHNHQNGHIIIKCTSNTIEFKNTGAFHALNSSKIFNRFSKINPANQGTGLGLSIVKKIAEINSWQIEYNYNNGFHSFTVKV